MGLFKPEKNIYSSGNIRYKKPKSDGKGEATGKISRRTFLKLGAATAAGIVLSPLSGFLKDFEKEEAEQAPSLTSELLEEEEITSEEKEVREEEIASVREILDFNQEGRLEITLDSIAKIKQHWKKKYSEAPMINDLRAGFKMMGAWEEYLKEIFKQESVPEEYIYLAIPESHWGIYSRSPKNAVGPYQFTGDTAKRFGLKMNKDIDERFDPILSGTACARLLADLYRRSRDWSVAFSGYNGGFIWPYLIEVGKEKRQRGYEEYLKFIGDKINKIREGINSGEAVFHVVEKGDTLSSISKKFKIPVEEIAMFNQILDSSKIMIGQKIKIPLSEKRKKDLFWKKISGYSENLNYPAKFYAVLELIKEGVATKKDPVIKFSWYKTAEGGKHKVRAGEWGMEIARSYKVSIQTLKKSNPKIDMEKISPGQELVIPGKTLSLAEISSLKKVDIERLRFLNPGIVNVNVPLPAGYNIKI